MRLFDENGTFVGEFIEATEEMIDHTKEVVSDKFSDSIFLGILCLIIAPRWTLLALFLILLAKTIKLILNTAWWIIKLPFSLVFKRRLPEF